MGIEFPQHPHDLPDDGKLAGGATVLGIIALCKLPLGGADLDDFQVATEANRSGTLPLSGLGNESGTKASSPDKKGRRAGHQSKDL